MADDALALGGGIVLGVVIAAVIFLAIREMNTQNTRQAQPSMDSYNVVRDERGRIETVESLNGMPLSGQQPQAPRVSE